jgi:signal transduction histidine kinase
MDARDRKPTKEREETDASLLAERTRTDAELSLKGSAIEKDEDRVVELARRRAEETLEAARERADLEMAATGTTREFLKEVSVERAATDEAVAQERDAAAAHLHTERLKHQRALTALLSLEREATDEGLVVERARADQVVATRDDFLGIVSHDLRGILGSIAMSAALIAQGAADRDEEGARKGHAERIQRGAARMSRLVGDLLDVVSLEAGKLRMTRLPCDPGAVVREGVEAYQQAFATKGITLEMQLPPRPIAATLDHERVLQVLANLLSNALKFTAAGGHVTVVLEGDAAESRFTVSDSGAGIPPGQAAAIFERFGQVNLDRRGHGLGLYIAKGIVEAHGGRIWADSPASGGAALHFVLPAA